MDDNSKNENKKIKSSETKSKEEEIQLAPIKRKTVDLTLENKIIGPDEFKNLLSRFNSTTKEEKEKKEIKIPGKINIKEREELMQQTLKVAAKKEFKKIKKINMDEHMNKMRANQLLTKAQNEIKQKIPNKINFEEHIKKMRETIKNLTIIRKPEKPEKSFNIEEIKNKNEINDINEKENIKKEKKRIEDLRISRILERKKVEEEHIKKLEEEEKKEKEEEDKRLKEEEEKKKKEEEERIKLEEELKKLEEEKKLKEEEEKKKLEEEKKRIEEEEKKRIEEENKIKKEEEVKKTLEQWKNIIEEKKKKREEEAKKKIEIWKKKIEEKKKKREEEEKKRKEEQIKKEQEEKRIKELSEKKEKEEEDKLIKEYLNKKNKTKEELTPNELETIKMGINYKKQVDNYQKIKFREYSYNYEGKDIKYDFELIKEIPTEQIINLEISNKGQIIISTLHEGYSNIIIYRENTYEIEKHLILECHINSFILDKKNIYCSLADNFNNILIINLENTDNKIYLNGHNCSVTNIIITNYNYLVSSDIKGNIVVWNNNKIKKLIKAFDKKINSLCEISEKEQRIAVLSFDSQEVKFFDLRYNGMELLATIGNIMGSGLQNNMLKLNRNILAISGIYFYIIDINSFIITNIISCIYANDTISTSINLIDNKGYFFVSQALTNNWLDDIEKGILGYYEYEFISKEVPDRNPLIKKGEKILAHDNFITSIRFIDKDNFVTGSIDGKIKFWKLKNI